MSAYFIQLLMASSNGAPPDPPEDVVASIYSTSLVQVNWSDTSGGTLQTRVYRRSGGWTLLATAAVGVESYHTGDSAASGYRYGVSTFDPVSGLESSIVLASDLAPTAPTNPTPYTYAGTKKGISWTNSEALPVRCYRNSGLVTTKATGETAWDSGYTSGVLEVSHYNPSTGQESERVGAP